MKMLENDSTFPLAAAAAAAAAGDEEDDNRISQKL